MGLRHKSDSSKGQFSMDAEELETLKDKQEELPDDSLSFAAIASDDTETDGLCM